MLESLGVELLNGPQATPDGQVLFWAIDETPPPRRNGVVATVNAFLLVSLAIDELLTSGSAPADQADKIKLRLATEIKGQGYAILVYLLDHEAASFEDLSESVWLAPATDEAISKAVKRLRNRLIELGEPIEIEIGNSHVALELLENSADN